MVLGIYGSGGTGRNVKEIAEVIGTWNEIVFIDDTVKSGIYKGVCRMPFQCFVQKYSKEAAEVIIALGEPEHKINLYNKVKNTDTSVSRNQPIGNGRKRINYKEWFDCFIGCCD